MNKYEKIISSSLNDLIDYLSNEGDLDMFAIDFHPWDGLIEYSVLTKSEVEEDPLLKNSEEMADWKFFHVSSESSVWRDGISQIAHDIKISYEEAENKVEMIEAEYKCIVSAMESENVQSSLAELSLSQSFRISIANPDSGDEYYK